MPLIGQDDFLAKSPITGEVKNQVNLDAVMSHEDSILDIAGAAIRQENIIGSAISEKSELGDIPIQASDADERPLNKSFRFQDHVPQGYEQFAEMFAFTNDKDEVLKVQEFIDKKLNEQDIIRRNGITGIAAAMAAGIIDPTILIPGFGVVKGAKAARAAKSAVAGAAVAGVSVGVQEGVLQETQAQTRPFETSRNAVLAALALGGVVGGGIALMSKGSKEAATTLVGDALEDVNRKINVGRDGSLTVSDLTGLKSSEGLAKINNDLAKWIGGPEGMRSISLRGVTSDFGTVRKITNELFDHNFVLGKEIAGEARGPVFERALKIAQGKAIRLNSEMKGMYKDYVGVPRGGQEFSEIAAFTKAKSQGKLSFNEFDQEIGKAMRRGDTHKIPEVQKAAQRLRKEMDLKTARMQELGLLDETLDPKTATSYFMRKYKVDDIVENYDEFRGIVTDWLTEVNPGKSADEISSIADSTIDNIIGMGDQSLALSDMSGHMTSKSGKFTKERTFLIPDERIEKFLDSRGSSVGTQYLTQADSMIHMQELLQRNGWESINDARKAVRNEFDVRIKSTTDPIARKKLNKEFQQTIDLVNDMFKISLGQFGTKGKADSALRTLKKYQVMRLLGGVTLSSMPDTAMHVFKNGLPSATLDGIVTMSRNLKASKLAKDQLQDFAVGLELQQNTLLRNLTDPDFRLGVRRSRLETIADSTTEAFGKITLMTYWNNMHKRIAGQVSSANILRAVSKGAQASEKQLLRLRQMGIDEAMGKRIKNQFDKYGAIIDGSYVGNYHKWTDKDAKRVFGEGLVSDVDSTILTPGRGDLPRFASDTQLGSVIFQFKSFASTATNKLLIPALQRRDAEVLQGLTGLVSLGAMTYVVKERIAGREPDMSMDNLLMEGISRSGVSGLMGDYIMGLGNALPGVEGTSRYAGRSIEGMFLGPSADIIKDLADAGLNLADGDISESDAKRMSRMLPFNNLFYIRALLTKLKEREDE